MNASELLAALGGSENLVEIEPCVTRLRAVLNDPALIDAESLKKLGCHGILARGQVVQVVVGPQADVIASDLGEVANLTTPLDHL
ncbi:MAG: PTS transporter subunit EIIB [Propionibacteriaceae bacterium]|nr:PTS transporter subunit EIIB [Propionibacteriaceae bacterium]